MLKGDPDVARWSTYVGRGAIRFYLPLDVQLPNDFFAQAVVVAKDVAARERLRAKLENDARRTDFPSVVARVSPLELGPPVGWPVQYRVSGPDIEQVRDDRPASSPQIVGAERQRRGRSISTGSSPPARCASRSTRIRRGSSGLSSQGARRRAERGDDRARRSPRCATAFISSTSSLRAHDEQRVSLSTLRTLQFPLPNGAHRAAEPGRELRFRAGISADLAPRPRADLDGPGRRRAGALAGEPWSRALAPGDRETRASLPRGYHIEVGGTVEESAQSQASVFAVIPLMLFLMLTS